MSRWDNDSFDKERYDLTSDNEEIKLLKKFEDYKKLERIEFEKIKIENHFSENVALTCRLF